MQDLIFKLSVDLIIQSGIDGRTIIQTFCSHRIQRRKNKWREPNVKEDLTDLTVEILDMSNAKGPDNLSQGRGVEDDESSDLGMGCGELGKLHSIFSYVYLKGNR